MSTVNDMVAELNFRSRKTIAFDAKLNEIATDPPVSEAQRKAMWAAKSGNSTLGIPQKVGAEFAKADPGGKLPKAKDGGPGSGPKPGGGSNEGEGRKSLAELYPGKFTDTKEAGRRKQQEIDKERARVAGGGPIKPYWQRAKDSLGRWGGRARNAMNMDAWTNSILDKFEKEKEDAHEMAPKKVEDTVKEPERVAKDNESFNPNALKPETPAQRRRDEASLVKDGRWGGRAR